MTEAIHGRTPVNMLRSYMGIPLNVLRTGAPTLGRQIAEAAKEVDIMYLDYYRCSSTCRAASRDGSFITHATRTTNSGALRRSGQQSPLRLAARTETARVRGYESKVCNAADIAATPADIVMRPFCNAGAGPKRLTSATLAARARSDELGGDGRTPRLRRLPRLGSERSWIALVPRGSLAEGEGEASDL